MDVGDVMGLAGQQMQDHLGLFILGILLTSWGAIPLFGAPSFTKQNH